ncbi:MAG: hypothetical protein ABFS34_13335, partial [Gemmatimonadota bacterium]
NLVLLCRRHHRAVHEGRAMVCRGADDAVAFFMPDGRVLHDAPQVARNGGGNAASNGRAGAVQLADLRLDRPSWRNGASRWVRYRDVPWAVEVRALEAVDGTG